MVLTYQKKEGEMSLKEISDALEKAKKSADGFSWVDEEFSELLIKIAEHILEKDEYTSDGIPHGYVSLKAFERAYKIVSAETLRDYCNNDQGFNLNTCYLHRGRWWYVNEEKTLDFLKKKTFFKKRMERLGGSW